MRQTIFNTLFLFIFSSIFLSLRAQNDIPKIPTEYSLIEKGDYAPYEAKVLELIKWLEESPIGTEKEARAKAYKFLFDWINGCPYVHSAMHDAALEKLAAEQDPYFPDYMLAYNFGMVRYMLETGDAKKFKGTEVEIQIIGIEKMVTAYQKAKNKKRSKAMEEMASLVKKGKLQAWVVENIHWDGAIHNLPTQQDSKGKRT